MKMDDKQLKEQQIVISVELMEGWVDPDGNREEDEDACLLITVANESVITVLPVKHSKDAADVYLLTETYQGYKAGTHVVFKCLGQLRILVEEEYGFRYWLWTYTVPIPRWQDECEYPTAGLQQDPLYVAENMKKATAYFKTVTGPEDYYSGLSQGGVENQFEGEWREFTWEQYRDMSEGPNWDMYAHVHENSDSHIYPKGTQIHRVLVH